MTFKDELSLREKIKTFQNLSEESLRRAKNKNQEPQRVHIAIFPSIMALSQAGAGDWLISRIKGQYSAVLHKDTVQMKGTVFKEIYTSFQKMAKVDWVNEQSGHPLALKEIAAEATMNKIPDVIITKITVLVPWVQYNNNTLKNESFMLPWTFSPYTFRKGTWKRLKALDFPAKRLYEEYLIQKRELLESMSDVTKKRWRDTLLMNEPQKQLTNQEIRAIWSGQNKCVLLLKESRGNFDLMNIGEWK